MNNEEDERYVKMKMNDEGEKYEELES